MTPNLRIIAFGTALGAGLVISAQGFATTASDPSPGFSWKTPAPTQPVATLRAPTPRAATPTAPTPRATPPATTSTGSSPASGKTASGTTGDQTAPTEPPPPYDGAPLSTDQLGQEYQNLSPEVHAALQNLVKTKGIDGLSSMSESDARSAFNSLPANVKQQVQAKWDSLSDEQRIAMKKLGPDAIKQMFASQMKQMMQASVAPVMKPVEQVVQTTAAVIDKTKSVLKRSREYVQSLIAKLRGSQSPSQADE